MQQFVLYVKHLITLKKHGQQYLYCKKKKNLMELSDDLELLFLHYNFSLL